MATKYFCDRCGDEKYNPNELGKLSNREFVGLSGNEMLGSSFDLCKTCMKFAWDNVCKGLKKTPANFHESEGTISPPPLSKHYVPETS